MKMLLSLALSYLIGSVPFALVVGKLFYRTDIRQYGSKNLGGGNTGRVLGARAGLAVMTLDLLKVTLAVFLARELAGGAWAMSLSALAAAAGHCWPVFAGFKGGKAVAALYGFLFSLWVIAGHSPLFFFLPLVIYLVVLRLTRVVSLSSLVSAVAAAAGGLAALGPGPEAAALAVFAVLVTVRHRSNLDRLRRDQENKITWM